MKMLCLPLRMNLFKSLVSYLILTFLLRKLFNGLIIRRNLVPVSRLLICCLSLTVMVMTCVVRVTLIVVRAGTLIPLLRVICRTFMALVRRLTLLLIMLVVAPGFLVTRRSVSGTCCIRTGLILVPMAICVMVMVPGTRVGRVTPSPRSLIRKILLRLTIRPSLRAVGLRLPVLMVRVRMPFTRLIVILRVVRMSPFASLSLIPRRLVRCLMVIIIKLLMMRRLIFVLIMSVIRVRILVPIWLIRPRLFTCRIASPVVISGVLIVVNTRRCPLIIMTRCVR